MRTSQKFNKMSLLKCNEEILTLLLYPKYAPTNVSGTEIPNHRASNAISVEKGMAALLPSAHSTRFNRKNTPNTTL